MHYLLNFETLMAEYTRYDVCTCMLNALFL